MTLPSRGRAVFTKAHLHHAPEGLLLFLHGQMEIPKPSPCGVEAYSRHHPFACTRLHSLETDHPQRRPTANVVRMGLKLGTVLLYKVVFNLIPAAIASVWT